MECLNSVEEVVEEIMRIHRSLPARPGIDEVEVARGLIGNVEKEDQARLQAIARRGSAETLVVVELGENGNSR